MIVTTLPVDLLFAEFGTLVRERVPLAPYTSARIGGPADALITVSNSDELEKVIGFIWEHEIPYLILGGGSNVLVSDRGVRGAVVLNRAKQVRFEEDEAPRVWCEAGAVFSNLANRCATRGLAGLEWAATVPGTVGGAVYGNAGAFGGDMAGNLIWAEVLTRDGRRRYPADQMGYGYRTSVLKRGEVKGIVLSVLLGLKTATRDEVSVKIEQFVSRRKATQPAGASMGSMFKNPPGDHAGRLIEAAGLKGTRIGNVEISTVHANFFINRGDTTAEDVQRLIELARSIVRQKFGIELELEVEFVGDWSA
jgi:UDP-N-acetylmuramate dehydrogenase